MNNYQTNPHEKDNMSPGMVTPTRGETLRKPTMGTHRPNTSNHNTTIKLEKRGSFIMHDFNQNLLSRFSKKGSFGGMDALMSAGLKARKSTSKLWLGSSDPNSDSAFKN